MDKIIRHGLEIAAGLDKASKDEMMRAVREVFTEGAIIDFQNKENIRGLREFAKVFKSVFERAGNNTIDFNKIMELPSEDMFKELGRIAATSFWDAWNTISSSSGGFASERNRIEAEFNSLIQTQKQKMQELEDWQSKLRKKKDAERRLYFDMATKERVSYKSNDDLKTRANTAYNEFDTVNFELQEAKEAGRVTEKLLSRWRDAATEIVKVKNTVDELKFQVVHKTVKDGGIFGKTKSIPLIEEILGSRMADYFTSEIGGEGLSDDLLIGTSAIEDFVDTKAITDKIGDIQQSLIKLDNQIADMSANYPDLVDKQKVTEAEEAIDRVSAAYDRLLVKSGSNKGKLKAKALKDIQSAIDYSPKSAGNFAVSDDMSEAKIKSISEKEQKAYAQLKSLAESYAHSEGSSWEQRAQYLLKFIKEYEAQVNNPTLSHELTSSLASLYKELKPIEESTKTMLQNVVNMANNVPEIGIDGSGSGAETGDGTGSGDASSSETENLRQQLEEANRKRKEAELAERVAQENATAERHATEEAEERAEMYRRAMDSMQEEMADLRGQLADAGSGSGDGSGGTPELERVAKTIEEKRNVLEELQKKVNKSLEDQGTNMYVATQEQLDKAKQILSEYEKILVKTAGGKNLTLGPDMSNQDLMKFLGMDAQKAKNVEFTRKAGIGTGASRDNRTEEDVENARKVAEYEAQARAEAEAKAKAEKEAREEAERQAQAEKEKEESLKRQRAAEERIAKAKERTAKAAAEKAASEEKTKALILEQKQALLEMLGMSNEAGLFFDSKTGEISDIVEGGAHSVETTSGAWNKASTQYDGRLHSHNYDVAAPSFSGKDNDFAVWLKGFDYIKKQMILANKELLSFDFSSISRETLRHIAALYSKAAREIDKEFDGYVKNGQVGEKFGTLDNWDEQFQARLRDALNSIMEKSEYAGIMTSQQLPQDIIDTHREQLAKNQAKVAKKPNAADGMSLADEYERANDEVKELIKQLAVLYSTYDDSFVGDTEEDPIMALEERLRNLRPDLAKIEASQFEDLAKTLTSEEQSTILAQIKSEAAATEQAVDGLNESLEKTQQLASNDGAGAGTGDASLSELEVERGKAESLQNEIEQKNSALQAANEEKQALQNDLDTTRQQLVDSEHEKSLYDSAMNQLTEESDAKDRVIYDLREQLSNGGDAIFTAEQRANEAEERASNLERKLAESFDGDKKQGSVNTEELKTLLNSIVYNVKIVHDDNDKTANKIALDDSTLETTLTKVFANILNPQTQQNDSEQKQSSWALESTLQTVKGVLDNIHTNTTKIGSFNTSNVDAIAGTALDGRLTEIRSVLESIDNKIAKGGVIATRGAVKQANAQPIESEAKTQAARSNMLKSLINDYKTLGKLSAQFSNDGNLETQAMLKNLKEEIARKRQSLNITMDENRSLREKYSIAFDAEKRLLDAAKAQAKINEDNRDDKTAWKKKVKDAQRAMGVNAATSAVNAGDQTVLRAIGTEGVSQDIANKAKELSDQIKTLRVLRDEIDKKGEKASDEDRDNLSKQISKVKELKTEVDGYLKIHEKYSGDNVTDLGDASNFGAVGTDQYWNNITAAIKKAQSGKMTIKGLNADTGELTGTTKIAANTFATWSATVDPLTGRLSMLRTGIKKTETLVEIITRKTKEIFTYFSGSSIIFKAFNELKKGVQYVRDIDLALTELKKVTDETEETYRKFLDTASKTAAKVGSTIKDVISSTADWARLGYSMKEAAEFAESTQILMNVSEFTDVSQATDTLISAVQAFGYTAETSMDVVDLLNTIGKIIAYR